MVFVRAVNDPTGYAGMVVILKQRNKDMTDFSLPMSSVCMYIPEKWGFNTVRTGHSGHHHLTPKTNEAGLWYPDSGARGVPECIFTPVQL